MPHATQIMTGLQALILCGPGESLQPFAAKPDELPKALIPIANRPMVWYALDWCYRTGITNISLVTPEICLPPLEAALSQNPHLTSLPGPKPALVSSSEFGLTSGTADVLRSSAVQAIILQDFIVLPCDIVCEQNGLGILGTWFKLQGALSQDYADEENRGRRGGFGIWYDTIDSDPDNGPGVKKEESDFLATSPSDSMSTSTCRALFQNDVEEAVLAMPMATVKDNIEDIKGLKIRYALLRKYGMIKMNTRHRDAHLYIFPVWVKDYVRHNTLLESISEDVIGSWVKARWQTGLAQKLHFDQCLGQRREIDSNTTSQKSSTIGTDMTTLSTTCHSKFIAPADDPTGQRPSNSESLRSTDTVPPFLTQLHRPQPAASLLRRVDNVALLLSVSLFLAKALVPSDGDTREHPFAHESKIHPSSAPIPELRLTLDQATVLVDANVIFTSKSTIKEAVIGAGCVLGTPLDTLKQGQTTAEVIKNSPPGVRLQRCLLMEGVHVGSGSELSGCVLGRRCRIGKNCALRDCKVQDSYIVPDGTTAKGETFAGFSEIEGTDSDEGFDTIENSTDELDGFS